MSIKPKNLDQARRYGRAYIRMMGEVLEMQLTPEEQQISLQAAAHAGERIRRQRLPWNHVTFMAGIREWGRNQKTA